MGEKRFLGERDRRAHEELLSSCGLSFVPGKTLGWFEDDVLVASASLDGRTIKGVAVREDWRGSGILNTLVGELHTLARKEYGSTFVFTKPGNEKLFASLGFHCVYRTPLAVLLESRKDGVREWTESVRKEYGRPGWSAAIVMNANPFTLGHRYLAETAVSREESLLVLVVAEDGSYYSPCDRLSLVRKGLADLENVTVIPAPPYVISRATFPDYFLKTESDITRASCALDGGIFSSLIAPGLGIRRRYVGSEPFDTVTALYNEALRESCCDGFEIVEIERKDGISASRVRKLLGEKNLREVKKLVPSTTYEYLLSRFVAEEGIRALRAELETTPKPGLVDRNNSGAHSDMDHALFERSIDALEMPFRNMGAASSLSELRERGMEAEKAMFAATGGVNTHKGAIFLLGLLMNAVYRLGKNDAEAISSFVKEECASISSELERASTKGGRAYREYGFKGARGIAEDGFSSVIEKYLPIYSGMLEKGRSEKDAAIITLLSLIRDTDDTNIVTRIDRGALLYAKERAGEYLSLYGDKVRLAALMAMDRDFIARRISPGGSADLLSCVIFLHAMAEASF